MEHAPVARPHAGSAPSTPFEDAPTTTDAHARGASDHVEPTIISWDEPADPPSGSPPRRMSDALRPHYLRHRRAVDASVYVLAALGAWSVRFVQDDAFISFRYARNLAEGRGLVFNPGERVEGYTNFLWTLLMAVPESLGWSTPLFAQLVGIVLMLATVAVTWRLARRALADEVLALLAVVVLLTNMTFLSYATGGLETMLQTLLVMSVAALLLPVDRFGDTTLTTRHLLAGTLGGLAVLTRLDSAVLLVTIVGVHLIVRAHRTDPGRRFRLAAGSLATMAVPAAVLVLPWLVWKVGYYGSLLPNTFVAKSGSGLPGQVLFAFVYLATFFVGYGYFLLIGRFRRQRRELLASSAVQQVGWVVPVWLLYIVAAGADFMEFRFMVPILPVLAMLGAVLVDRYVVPWRQVALIALLLLASYGHVALPSLGYPVHTLHDLNIWPTTSERALGSIGARLADAFPGGLDREDQVVMAFGSLGALPYGSQLPTIDMMGLADAHVAEHGEPLDAYYPGHLRIAPIDYLVERGVNLVATVRVDVEPDVEREHYRMSELLAVYPVVDLRELPPHATALEIPMDDHMSWLAIYLTPHPDVQRMIDRGGWQQYPIERVCDPDDVNPLVKIFGSATCD